MPATQIPQGSSSTLNAPALRLGEVTTDEVIFIGPAISLTEAVTTALPYMLTTAPVGWTVIVTSAVAGESCNFSVMVPVDAVTTTGGGYNLTYFDAAGDLYSVWFDVIEAGTTPAPVVIVQLTQGRTSPLTIPLVALSYKSAFISVESPKAGTWLDDGTQTPLPYMATFAEAPAPVGWTVILTVLTDGVSYASTIRVPETFELGVYTITVTDGHGKIYETQFEVIPAAPSQAVILSPCGCTTGFNIISEVQVRLQESQSTTALQQAMLYTRHVRRVMDEVARRTWCIYKNAVTDLISGQLEYIPPARPYELRTVCVNDGNGNIRPLTALTPTQANNNFYNWQSGGTNSTYQGVPRFYVEQGTSTFIPLPVPNYNCQDGLIVGGYLGVDEWYTPDMCIPFDTGFEEVIVLGVAWRRCIEMAPFDPMYAQMLPQYKSDYLEILDRLYMESMRRTASRRGGLVPSSGNRVGSFGGCWGWWGV